MVKKILVLLAAFFILVPNSYALYLRLHMPVSTSATEVNCTQDSIDYDCTPKTSGYSLRAIFGLFGVGYASSTFDWGFPSSANTEITTTTNAADLSLSILDAMITVGVGTVIGGEATGSKTMTLFDLEFSGDTASGSTSFLNFGFGLGPMELIAGYRIWDVKYANNVVTFTGKGALSGQSATREMGDTEIKYNEMTIGVGIGF